MNAAVVTPYYREPPVILHRCLDSVVAQTHPDVRCVILPVAHTDFGNTPRGVGTTGAAR